MKCGTFENYLLKKLWRRAAPAAQRRPAGEPKARPGAFRRIRNTTPIKISDIFLQLPLLTKTHFFTRSISRSFSGYFVAITPVRVHDSPVKNTTPPPGGGGGGKKKKKTTPLVCVFLFFFSPPPPPGSFFPNKKPTPPPGGGGGGHKNMGSWFAS